VKSFLDSLSKARAGGSAELTRTFGKLSLNFSCQFGIPYWLKRIVGFSLRSSGKVGWCVSFLNVKVLPLTKVTVNYRDI